MAVGLKLRSIRESRELKREQVAVGADIPYDTLVAIETERTKRPGWDTIEKLANFYGISLDELRSNPEIEVMHDNHSS